MTHRKKRKRLDELLIVHQFASTLHEAERLIRAGEVYVDESRAEKPGHLYSEDSHIKVKKPLPYVSRGGIKLAGALDYFAIDPAGWTCADIGASSGGFTDCLLKHGAKLVYAVDVAYGQLDWKLRTDPRVVVHERLNVRNISPEHIPRQLDLAVFDVSFISLKLVIPPVLPFLGQTPRILALLKPQFEVVREKVGSGGIVTDKGDRLNAVDMICRFGQDINLRFRGYVPSQIRGAMGNQEYLIYFAGKRSDSPV